MLHAAQQKLSGVGVVRSRIPQVVSLPSHLRPAHQFRQLRSSARFAIDAVAKSRLFHLIVDTDRIADDSAKDGLGQACDWTYPELI
jgi:hypothetical protein